MESHSIRPHYPSEEDQPQNYDEESFKSQLVETLSFDTDGDEKGDDIDFEDTQNILEVELNNITVKNFDWSADFTTFRGQREEYLETPGPKIKGTGPMELFLQIWDQSLIDIIKTETNRYAQQEIERASEFGIAPASRWNHWRETSTAELYRLLSIFILMETCVRTRLEEYWRTDVMGMPKFRQLMTLDRFWLLSRFLHFSNNEDSLPIGHPDRELEKISPLLDKLNYKFQEIYTPQQEITIDESMLLWKGHYELCEAVTGYCAKFLFYTDKNLVTSEPVLGFTSARAKIVIKLMQGFLGKGFTLFIDTFYNSINLCRFLKLHKTDVVGTLDRRRADTPNDIKMLNDHRMARGEVVSRHCGDLSVVAWKDVNLVTTVSTYHNADMAVGQSTKCSKPEAIRTYNSYKRGEHLKDQMLSMYLLKRKRGVKWYMKVFRRLLNVSVFNAYIIHCANTDQHMKLTHQEFRYRLADDLIQSFGENTTSRNRSNITECRLNSGLSHNPENLPVENVNRTAKQESVTKGDVACDVL